MERGRNKCFGWFLATLSLLIASAWPLQAIAQGKVRIAVTAFENKAKSPPKYRGSESSLRVKPFGPAQGRLRNLAILGLIRSLRSLTMTLHLLRLL